MFANVSKDKKIFLFSIVIAFICSVLARLSLAIYTYGKDGYMYKDKFISILTPDAGLYGYYAQLLLDNKPHNIDVSLIEYVIYFAVKFLGFELDSVMYFGPAILASLIIVPIMLILKEYTNSTLISMLSAFVASTGYGYYSRSYLGYFDTDVLNLFFPLVIIYGMMMTYRTNQLPYILISVVSNILYYAWYHSCEPVLYAINGFFVLFGLIFYLRNTIVYKSAILLAISVVKIAIFYKLILLVLVYMLLRRIDIDYRYFLGLVVVGILAVLAKKGIDYTVFVEHLNRYFFKESIINHLDFNFVAPMQYVAEAVGMSYISMMVHMCGNPFIFVVSAIGYLLFVYRHKEFVLTLPMLVLGIISIKAGVRFYIYGVFVMILAYGFFAYTIYQLLLKKIQKKIIIQAIIILLFVSPLYETAYNISFWNTKVAKPVFDTEQVTALKHLKKIAKDNSYVVTWWDYGWPVWYYTSLQTLIDNGRHFEDNYTVAKLFMMSSQKEVNKGIHYFYDLFNNTQQTAIVRALDDNSKDINKVFELFKQDDFNPPKETDKYIVIPIQMKELLFTMHVYENIDIKTGMNKENKIFMELKAVAEDDKYIFLERNIGIDKQEALIMQGDSKIPIKRFDHVVYKDDQKLLKQIDAYDAGLYVINFLGSYYIMDEYFYNSIFVQLLFFNNYDDRYFEDVLTGKTIAIYKVK